MATEQTSCEVLALQEKWAKYEESRRKLEAVSARSSRSTPRRLWPLFDSGNIQETESLQEVKKFSDEVDALFLILAGGLGVGKTVAAAWATDSYQLSALFVDATEIARASWYDNEAYGRWERVDLLVIDDLGVEYADKKGGFTMQLDGLLNSRYNNGLKTIITTNLTLERFKERYSERVMDRIHECGRFVELRGRNLRRTDDLQRT